MLGCAGPSLLCRLSLVAASRGHSLAAVCGLLTAVASLVLEQGLQGPQASVVVAHELSCMSDLPRPGIEPVSSVLPGGFLTTRPPGKSLSLIYIILLQYS